MSTKLCIALISLAAFVSAVSSGSAANRSTTVCSARAQDCMSAPEYRALMLRSVALNHAYGLGD